MSHEFDHSEDEHSGHSFSENNLSHRDDHEHIIAGGTRESFFIVRKPTKMRLVSKIPIQEVAEKTSARVASRKLGSSILVGTARSGRKKNTTHRQMDSHEDEISNRSSVSMDSPDILSDNKSVASSKGSRFFRASKASVFEKPIVEGGKTPKALRIPLDNVQSEIFTFEGRQKAINEKSYVSSLVLNGLEMKYLRAINDKAEFSSAETFQQNEALDRRLRGLLKKHAIKKQETYNITTVVKKLKMNQSRSFVVKAGVRAKNKLKAFYYESFKVSLKEFLQPLDPHSLFISIWNSILMLFVFYELMAVPFELAFDDFDSVFRDIEWVENVFFFFDMCFGFYTSWYQDGVLITDRRLIAWYYFKSWFIIDFLCCFPFQLLFEYHIIGASKSFITLMGLLRAAKVIRIGKYFKIKGAFAKMQDYVQLSGELSGIMRLFKLIFTIIFIAHWCACFWYLIGLHPGTDTMTWIVSYGIEDAETGQKYVKSLYWSIATLLTVGYGDIVATNMAEEIYSIFVMLLGSGIIGLSMNKIGEILQQINSEVHYREKKLHDLRKFMDKNEIDMKLQIKAKQYVEFKLEHERAMRDSDRTILQSLSHTLRDQMLKQVNGRLMKNSELFQRSFGSSLLNKLAMMLDEQLLAPDEYIYRENETENFSLYFISRGRVETFLEKYRVSLNFIEKGSKVGEYSFFSGRPRETSAKTVTFTSIFCLPHDKFIEILESFSTDKEMYHMLKDKINLLQDYSAIGFQCALCQGADHMVQACPKTHLVSNKENVIHRYLEHKQSFAKNFHRKMRKKFSPLNEMGPLEKLGTRVQAAEGVKAQFTNSFSESDINLSTTNKNKKFTFPHMDSLDESDLNNVAAEAIYKTLARVKDEETGVTKLQKNKKSMDVDEKRNLSKSVTMRHNGEAVFIPFKIQIAEQKPPKDYAAEELNIDQMRNYEIYFPHNNLRKVIDTYEYQRKKRKTIKINLNSEHDIMSFKMKLGKIFDKSKRNRAGDQSNRNNEPMTPGNRRKSMFFKRNPNPESTYVRLRSKSLNRVEDSEIQSVNFAQKTLVYRSRSKESKEQ